MTGRMTVYEYEYEDGEGGVPVGRVLAIAFGVVAIAAVGWFVVRPELTDDDGGDAVAPGVVTTTEAPSETSAEPPSSTDAVLAQDTETTAETTEPDATTETSVAPATTEAPTTSTSTTVTTTIPPTTTTVAAAYPTLPDGDAVPVVAQFDANKITLSGVVPDQAAKDRLEGLAVANAKPGQADTIDNKLTLNPAVPRNVGVRVLELTSVRFPDGSSEVLPPHAAELDRVATIMNALPNVTTLIVGHADQRGTDLSNYAISEARALAVKNYLISKGISPERLSSRAVGEADLLSVSDDAASLALNRRTEFIFDGLLIE